MRTGSAIGAVAVALAAGWVAFGMGRGTGQSLDFSAGMSAVVFLSVLLVGLALAGAFTKGEPQLAAAQPPASAEPATDLGDLDDGVTGGPPT